MALLISLVAVVAADVFAILGLLSCCDVPGSVAFNVILEFFEKKHKVGITTFYFLVRIALLKGHRKARKKEPLFFRE